ncbi:hypothetical protein CKO51_25445 [Rhodopirellula sp. SM50]|nr:hypothetical protein CKO51_25445 [Rhodopirellula sp. SM50]
MILVEPRLIDLEHRARRMRKSRNRWLTYRTFKNELESLVGWHCSRPEISSSAHYEVVVDRVLSAMRI